MGYENGIFEIANPAFTPDLDAAIESVKKIMRFDIDTIICYHGGVVRNDIREGLAALISRYR